VALCPASSGQIVYPPRPVAPEADPQPVEVAGAAQTIVYPPFVLPEGPDPALADSAIGAVVAANGGKPPATGEQLTKALARLGKFAQLPLPFSAVRLDSGLGNPRVIITPLVTGLSEADVTAVNFNARLYLAANMEKDPKGGDPRVTSVEFISWNAQRRRFDFGLVEGMGGGGEPRLHFVDGGRCFACHKNRGPILGPAPWSNSTDDPDLQELVAKKLRLVETIPPGPAGIGLRDRIDGMALAAPDAIEVDAAVRLGTTLRLNRETFQLMNRSPGGRKGFVAMLVAITAPGPLDPNDRQAKHAVDLWGNDQSYLRFASDWVALTKATHSGILIDFTPVPVTDFAGAVPVTKLSGGRYGSRSSRSAGSAGTKRDPNSKAAKEEALQLQLRRGVEMLAAQHRAENLLRIISYDNQRAAGYPGLTKYMKPSNPKAFIQPPARATQLPSGMVNPVMLASTIGITEGDRKFLAKSLKQAVERVNKPQVTAAALARAVFEGPQFADVLAGESFPDRDEFKDRFAEGLHELLRTKYPFTQGFPISRKDYASGPAFDPKLAAEKELAVVPTTACLRCHDVRAGGKPRMFESIPALAFDPFDKPGREAWVKTADEKRRKAVLIRLRERLFDDADMPPADAPEHDRFRVLDAAAFDELKTFLKAELAR
jgi:hypothetical protein